MSESIIPSPSEEERQKLLENMQHGVPGAREAYTKGGEDLEKWRASQKK